MSKELTASWLRPRRLVIISAVMLAFAVAGVALQPVFPVSGAPQAQAEDADGPGVVFQVHPTFIKFPESRIRDHGIWFVAAGLEDAQEVKIRMVWGAAELETDITSVLDVGFDEELGGLFANVPRRIRGGVRARIPGGCGRLLVLRRMDRGIVPSA